jgi:ubiquitin-protein ligase
MPDIARQYKTDRAEYEEEARRWTLAYAQPEEDEE